MNELTKHWLFRGGAVLVAMLTAMTGIPITWAASHREAPLISLDPVADITDVYAFRSWEDDSKVVFIMNVIPSQVPASGPNFYNFDPTVRYAFHFDFNRDGDAGDITVEFTFPTELRDPFRSLGLPLSFAGDIGPVPPITALDGSGSEGLGLRQRYTVRALRADGGVIVEFDADRNGQPLFAVPSNVGSRTMPNYEALAAQGVYELPIDGVRVFAGQRKETFYIDLGAAFDTLNFRQPPVLTDADDANDSVQPFGVNDFEGLNVNTIAFEIPINLLPPVIGMYASTRRRNPATGQFEQVARMANPLVNELLIGTGQKDRWNASNPREEADFLDFYQNPRLALALAVGFGIPIPPTPRDDLVSILLKYEGQPSGCSPTNRCSELLRLNLQTPATPPNQQRRLGPLAHDAAGNPTPDVAGWPNGRRPNDDVTDIALRAVAGVLSGDPCCGAPPHTRLGDGVNFNSGATGSNLTPNGISTVFPFLPTPIAGRR